MKSDSDSAAASDVHRPTLATFQWPVPPFFRLSPESASGRARACIVEFLDGHQISGELVSMDPNGRSAWLQPDGRSDLQQLDLVEVRTIRLKQSQTYVTNNAVLDRMGVAKSLVTDEKPFVVSLRDGSQLKGRTRGFRKGCGGLFLFLPGEKQRQSVTCFIPGQQLQDLKLGPPLGEVLVGKGLVDDRALELAMNRRTELRQERLGDYLMNHAIVSAEELTAALQEQSSRPNARLGEILVEAGLIRHEDLEKALSIQAANRGRRLGDILVSMGIVSLQQFQMVLSEKLGIPYVNVTEFKIDPSALDLVTCEFATRHQWLPLLRTENSLIVAVENPLLTEFEQELQRITGLPIVPVIGDKEEIRARIAKECGAMHAGVEIQKARPRPVEKQKRRDASPLKIEELAAQLEKEALHTTTPIKDSEEELRVSDSTLVKLVDRIIIDAHEQGVSDIHIETDAQRNTRIRFRKDGDLEDYLELQPAYRNALVSRIKIMADLDISEHRRAQDGKINFGKFGPLSIELRVAIVPTTNSLQDVVLRILGGVEPLPLEKLGMMEWDIEELKRMSARSYGLILVCGPTGSGKTTTLHSVLHHINSPDMKIWTAEDPIEITQVGLRQVQVNSKIGWTFAAAMRSFLRADPDVIMVGEMRDAETAKMGIEASLTGHLVFSTLHTNSAAESAVRLLDLGMDPFNFADALIGILSQRLVRQLCPDCRKPRVATDAEMSDLAKEYCVDTTLDPQAVLAGWLKTYGRDGQLYLHEPVGCEKCKKGYRGRKGVYELLTATPAVKQLVRSRGTVPQIVEAAIAGGMHLLKQDALLKVLRGDIDLVSARAAAS